MKQSLNCFKGSTADESQQQEIPIHGDTNAAQGRRSAGQNTRHPEDPRDGAVFEDENSALPHPIAYLFE